MRSSVPSAKNVYNGHLIQKLRVKCSVTYFFVRALTFSLVSYYMTRSPQFFTKRVINTEIAGRKCPHVPF